MWQMGLAEPPPISLVPLVFRPSDRYPWLEQAWKDHLNNLRDMHRVAHDLGAQLLVVVIPTREQVYEFLRPKDPEAQWEQPNTRLRTFFEAEQIHSLDLLKEFQARAHQAPRRELNSVQDLYWPVDPHFNIAGNRLAGLLVSRYLLEHRLVDPPDRQQRLARVERELEAEDTAPIPIPTKTSTRPQPLEPSLLQSIRSGTEGSAGLWVGMKAEFPLEFFR
jgi:hypothetical protein